MYLQQKTTRRGEYREQEIQRVRNSPGLTDKFPQLKSLALDLGHYSPEGVTRNSQIRFTPNLANAKSVFRIACPNRDCIGGDFDLTHALAEAVTARRTTVSSELCCQGWLNRTTINTLQCRNILRYTLHLHY